MTADTRNKGKEQFPKKRKRSQFRKIQSLFKLDLDFISGCETEKEVLVMILISTSLREQTPQKLNFGVGSVMSSQTMLALCCTAFVGL